MVKNILAELLQDLYIENPPDGFLVVHEMTWLQPNPPQGILDHWRAVYPGIRMVLEYVEQIPRLEYELITYFTLPDRVWWNDYYDPLQKRINQLRETHARDKEAQKVLDRQEREINLYKRYSKWYGSVFYVMPKVGP